MTLEPMNLSNAISKKYENGRKSLAVWELLIKS